MPVYLWAYLLLSTIPALCLRYEVPEGALLMIVQPFLAYRLQLRATSSDEGE